MSAQNPTPSPILFYETVNAYERTAALKAAVELDLFTAIGEGKQTPAEIAERCVATERGVRILCDFLVVCGFITKQDARYELTKDSSIFLDRRSPAYLGGTLEFLLAPTLIESFKDLAAAVRKGGTTLPEEGTTAPENPVWVNFARGMASMMRMPAQLMTGLLSYETGRKLKVLDIAAGHGMYGITFALANAGAEITALDWPNVLEVAKENAERAGLSERYRTIAGSAFDVEYGNDYDLILITNFLHHFDSPTCEKFLSKVRAALADNGRAVTIEFVPNEDRITPPATATFALTMLATTPHGDAYTFAEFERMFQNAGFSGSELHQLPPTPSQAIISHK
jgi:2-polyprenyl-3-methyl-5-hydroxy-6-metoxy-1,4-benzoquinol methylase